jgi:hypothetical protein
MRSKIVFLALAALLAACGGKEKPAGKPAEHADRPADSASGQSSLVGSERAPDLAALADSVRARALRGDTVGLVRLMLNDAEYRAFIYPVSPAYDSSREEVYRFVSGMHKANSIKGLKRLLADAREPASATSAAGDFDARGIPGGVLHEAAEAAPNTSGFRPFSAVFCRPEGCQVVSFAEAGAYGDARGD